jgi:SpoVK/Ycf46/Vps4 family AAA+-type ATPase
MNNKNTQTDKNRMNNSNTIDNGYDVFHNKKKKNRNKQRNHNHKPTIINNYYGSNHSNTHHDNQVNAEEMIDKYKLNKPIVNPVNNDRYSPTITSSSPTFENQNSSSSPTNVNTFSNEPPNNLIFVHRVKHSLDSELRSKIISEQDKEEVFEEILISKDISHITDLIKLSEQHIIKPNVKYSIDLHKLNKIVPHLKELNEMIGMEDIKKSLTYQLMYFLQGFEFKHMLHTIIEGPPGVGKTCLGKILGKIYLDLDCINKDFKAINQEDEDDGPINFKKLISTIINQETEHKVPKKNIFKIAKRSDLVGQYVGHTAVKTQKIINESFGGVLFIDEAYSLGGDDAYSKECINTINQNLSENGDKFVCIIAGYSDALENSFFSLNSGLHRRFPFRFKIEKYTGDELTKILRNKIIKEKYIIDESYDNKLSKFIEENKDYFPNFGGDIETYYFHVKMMHSTRVFGKTVSLKNIFTKDDFVNALDEMKKNQKKKEKDLNMYS